MRGRLNVKIKIINPNITQAMTDSVHETALRCADPETEIITVNPQNGPESIECFMDEYLAVPGVVEEILKGDKNEGADAFIIACFGDPGLAAAREVTDKPVLGICESAITAARFTAPYFSILSVLERSRKVTEDIVKAYGAADMCRSIRSTGLSVLEFGQDPQKGLAALAEEGRRAVKEDGAECLLLGCAGFVDFVDALRQELKVPVMDGVSPAVKFAEALVKMGAKTSKINTWRAPEPKLLRGFAFMDGLYSKR